MAEIEKPLIQSLERALDVLETISGSSEPLQSKDISIRVGLKANTSNNILRTLYKRGYLAQDDYGRYCIGPKILEAAASPTYLTSLRRAALPEMKKLSSATGDSTFLGVESGRRLEIIAQTEGELVKVVEKQIWQEQFHCTAAGKIFMASHGDIDWLKVSGKPLSKLTSHTIVNWQQLQKEIEEINTQGYALCRDESADGISAIGVKVSAKSGKIICVLSQSFPSYFLDTKKIDVKQRVKMMHKTADLIAAAYQNRD